MRRNERSRSSFDSQGNVTERRSVMMMMVSVVDGRVMDFVCQMNARHGNGAAVGHDFDGQIAVVLLSWNDFRMQMSYRKEQLLRRLLELLLLLLLLR